MCRDLAYKLHGLNLRKKKLNFCHSFVILRVIYVSYKINEDRLNVINIKCYDVSISKRSISLSCHKALVQRH